MSIIILKIHHTFRVKSFLQCSASTIHDLLQRCGSFQHHNLCHCCRCLFLSDSREMCNRNQLKKKQRKGHFYFLRSFVFHHFFNCFKQRKGDEQSYKTIFPKLNCLYPLSFFVKPTLKHNTTTKTTEDEGS